jgi:hypothetical protein
MADGKWLMANDRWLIADGEGLVFFVSYRPEPLAIGHSP